MCVRVHVHVRVRVRVRLRLRLRLRMYRVSYLHNHYVHMYVCSNKFSFITKYIIHHVYTLM